MNKIFKVIWSKTRNCYIVASELAKGHTKASSTGDKTKRLALAAITALMLLPVGGFSYATINSATINGTSVITGTQKDADNISGTVMKATNNERDIGNLKTAMQSVETELAQHQSVIDNLGTDKLTLSSDNTLQKESYDSTTKTTTTTDATGLKVAGSISAESASISGTLSAGGAVNAGSVNSRGNITAVGTIAGQTVTATGTIKGKDLIGTNSIISQGTIAATGNISSQATVGAKEMVSQTNITAQNQVVGMQGVIDHTLTSGTYVTAGNTVGENIVALDTQAKANADAINEEAKKRKYSVTNLEKADAAEAATREAKDNELNERITNEANAIHEITNKLQSDLTTETADRKTADNELNERITNEANAIHETTNKLQSDLTTETADRKTADNELNERITNEANAIHETTNKLQSDLTTETTAREAADTVLDTRITNVKEYLEKQTSDNYVSKTDAAVQDGAIVKAAKTIGENVANLDAALDAEKNARIWADKTQDKVIQQVNQNMVDGFNTINKNMADGFNALSQADANELAGRVAADTKLAEAVNGGLSLNDNNVLQKNTTSVNPDGTVSTSKEAATTLVMNEGKENQITLSENGIKVGLNSTVQDANGFYAGGDTADKAKAALNADGSIKGANGAFTVDENGNVTSKATITGETVTDGKGASMSNGTVTGKTLTDGIATITNGNINTSGTITGGTVTSTGNISALGDIHAGGAITGASASIQGALTAGSATITGDLTAGGAIQGKSISDGTATMQNGNLTGVKNLSAETITTSGNATIGGDLTVNGKLNVDEIDLTKSGIVGDNNVTASTKVAAGEITSYQKATSAKDGSEKESAIDYDENGTSTWAKSTDADGNWNKSTLTVEGSDVTSKVVDSNKNSNLSKQTSTQSQSTLTDADKNTNTATQSATESSSTLTDKDGKTSTFKQRVDEILNQINSSDTVFSKIDQKVDNITSEVTDGTNTTSSTQTTTDITNTAKQGTITNDAQKLVNKASDTISNEATNDITNTSTNGNIANTANNGTISNTAKNIENTASENITNTAKNGSITNDAKNIANIASETLSNEAKNITNKTTDNMTNTIGKNLTTTVGGDMSTEVTGNQTNTVKGTLTETVTGKATENYNGGLETTITGEEKHTVNGDQINNITGSQTNTIGGNQTTTVTGDSSLTAENITNEAKNKITNKALDVETDASSSIVSKVSNEYGSNTSTQLSYQTTEEMSQADGKKASYLRGAAEEKSQLTDGDKKTTIDTIAGQTNTNITDGTNTSNDLQKADQIASSVTDGTNTTIVNQDAKSLASSITDGTKANNTNSTVDKSEQLIKADDTHSYAETKTAGSAVEALKSDGNMIIIGKDAATATVSSAVTDGTNTTGSTMTAKGITNSAAESIVNEIGDGSKVKSEMTAKGITNTAKDGTITNDAKDVLNKGTNSVINEVGNNQVAVTTDSVKAAYGSDTYTTWDASGITSATSGDMKNSAKNITNTAEGGTIYNKSKDILNEASGDILNFADGEIGNVATKITNITGDTTVTSDTKGTTFENKAHNTAIKEGTVTKTTISGNTIETGQATMDYADVMKDLGVHGNATVDGDTTLGKEGADTKLTVNSKSTFKDTVKLEKTLEVDGTSTFNNKVTVTKGGLDVNGGTTTDTLHVTSTSTFDGAATFKDVVTMEKDLSVGGNATVAGSMTASSYKVDDKTYIDANGINANNQKVVNVAPGRIAADSTDAVNGAQLYQTNERVTGVENKVNNLDSRVDKVGANAAALANLHPLEFDADSKWNIAAAVGGYKGETATAIGAFYRPNENVMVNVSSSFGTGENMYGGGISLRIGQGGNKARRNATNGLTEREKAMQQQINSLTNRLDALLSVINPNMSKEFPDVPENHWAYEAVSRLAGNGVIQGYEDGKYHGERTMTRYEMAEIIYNALSKGAKAEKKLVEEFKPELQAMAAQKKA